MKIGAVVCDLPPTNLQDASRYIQHAGIQRDRAERNLQSFGFEPDDWVLDIGCGPCDTAALIAERVPQGKVIAVDSNPAMVEAGRRRYPASALPNLEVREANALDLPDDLSVDRVVSFACLSWIPEQEHERVIAQIHRCLRPGGKLLLRATCAGDRPLNRAIGEVCRRKEWADHFSDFVSPASYPTHDSYRDRLTAAGFEVLRLEESSRSPEFDDAAALVDWLMTWVPEGNHLADETLQRRFINDVTICYLDRFRPDPDRITIPLYGVLIEATRKSQD